MLEVSNVTKKYDNFVAVKGLSFFLDYGEVLALVGPNGAGKSTTIKMICGLLEPNSGFVKIKENHYKNNSAKIKSVIGFVPEETAIYENMSIIEYLVFFGGLYGIKKPEAIEKSKRLLKSLQLDEEHYTKPLGNLSKGMKRKVLIARSLINDPELLVYDEPVSGLDPLTTNFLLNYILDLKKQGKCIIFTAHNLHHVEFVCDKIVVLNKGKTILNDLLDNVKKDFGEPTYRIKYKDYLTGKIKIKECRRAIDLNDFLTSSKEKNIRIIDIKTEEKTLEEIFLKITK